MEILESLGLQINGFFPHGASLGQWRSVSQAKATFIADVGSVPRLAARLSEDYGQDVVEIPLPIGLSQTVRFYEAIAGTFDCASELETVIALRLEAGRAQLAALREEVGGTPMAMAIRMLNTYRADQLAYDGLGDFAFLKEAGFELTLFVQGPPEEADKFEASLRARGIQAPVVVFPGPWKLAEAMVDAGIQVACAPDSSHNTISRAGIPMLAARTLEPYFSGIKHNVELLRQLLAEARKEAEMVQ
jgi:hypothetical protein